MTNHWRQRPAPGDALGWCIVALSISALSLFCVAAYALMSATGCHR